MAVSKDVLDRLEPWLVRRLQSFELDTNDLHEYVVTFLNLEAPQTEIYNKCRTDLKELLADETESFVDSLFAQISYLEANPDAKLDGDASAAPTGFNNTPSAGDAAANTGVDNHAHGFQAAGAGDSNTVGESQQQLNKGQSGFGGQAKSFGQNSFNPNGFPFTPKGFQPKGFPNGFPPNGFPPNGFPPNGFPPNGFPPTGFPPNGFPPNGFPPNVDLSNGMQPSFGFRGFSQQFPNGQNQRTQFNKIRKNYSDISSIHNELSVANKRLVVERIPAEFLNEEAIVEYFKRFGEVRVVNINKAQNLAEIEFSGHDMAVNAHKSPEPVFGNRFVRIYWRKKDATSEQQPELDVEAVRRMQAIKQQQFEEKTARRKQLSEKLKEKVQQQAQLLQQRQEMIKRPDTTEEHYAQAQKYSNELAEEIKNLRKELESLSGTPSFAGRGRGRGRGGSFRGSFRGGLTPYARQTAIKNASIDRRHTAVLLKGVPEDSQMSLQEMTIARQPEDTRKLSNDEIVVSFKNREGAEEFYNAVTAKPELAQAAKRYVPADYGSN